MDMEGNRCILIYEREGQVMGCIYTQAFLLLLLVCFLHHLNMPLGFMRLPDQKI